MAKVWTKGDVTFLRSFYPEHGKTATAREMGRSEASIRAKTSKLGITQNRSSPFFQEWQQKAADGKKGKKRPAQADVMKRLHQEGKLKKTPEQKRMVGVRIKRWLKDHEHPKGMAGKKHSEETLGILGTKSQERWASFSTTKKRAITLKQQMTKTANNVPIRARGSWKAGWREVGGRRIFFRSRWEANYGRYLEWLKSLKQIKEWEHEPETFWFDVKRGCVSYLPDFRVTNNSGSVEYHEVKGWMDARSKTKIKRMAKYHPTVKLIVIDAKAYKSLNKDVAKVVEEWE